MALHHQHLKLTTIAQQQNSGREFGFCGRLWHGVTPIEQFSTNLENRLTREIDRPPLGKAIAPYAVLAGGICLQLSEIEYSGAFALKCAHHRFMPVCNLQTGAICASLLLARKPFGDRVSFGPVVQLGCNENPAKHLAQEIDAAISLAGQPAEGIARPVLICAPLPALAHSATAVECDAAARRGSLCHQEITLIFEDAAISGDRADCVARLSRLRRAGFRLGIDMRRSNEAELTQSICVLIDTLIVSASALHADVRLHAAIACATGANCLVIAEGALWRDADALAALGIRATLKPRCDA
jgi:hypothetical protein